MQSLNSARLARLLAIVSSQKDMRVKSDLFKMYQNCKNIFTEMSKEDVECRRLKKTTVKYRELEQKLNESIQEFEQWITFATLIYG
jgi:hypothetical protein